ncbi:MAG TPA: YoaK family protein [Ohtaekwangia sp.]|uniref:YoaK family protein n=1 Tax=Ohtaekwangia sp. TaxID=2066019 RepID=UPI002F9439B4
MLRRYSNSRNLADNIRLGILTAFTAGMVNVASFLIFLSFSSNVTGYFAIFAAEIGRGDYYQVLVVAGWIGLFFLGSFTSNLIIIHINRNKYIAHAMPLVLEILCLLGVGVYGQFFYQETLSETEALLSLMLFAMGLQNGLTASISNFAVKTTHLTGATTDLGILLSMFTKKQFRNTPELTGKAKLIAAITVSYIAGAVIASLTYQSLQFKLFYVVCSLLVIVIVYDAYKLKLQRYLHLTQKKKKETTYHLLKQPGYNENYPQPEYKNKSA